MARKSKNKSSAGSSRKSGSASQSNSTKTTKKATQSSVAQRPPRRRAVMAAVCFFLGIFSLIGYFDAEPVFIRLLTSFVRGLIGPGYYALPPTLIMCSIILAFHKGRPVLFRSICTLLLTVVTGAIVHQFISDVEDELSLAMFGSLWTTGTQMQSGGIISGSIAELFTWLVGWWGATIVIFVAAAFFLMVTFNATFTGIVDAIKGRKKREYQPQYPQPDEGTPPWEHSPGTKGNIAAGGKSAITATNAVAVGHTQASHDPYASHSGKKRRSTLIPGWKKRRIDIPVDNAGNIPKDHFEDDEPNYERNTDKKKKHKQVNEDLQIDIPFMDGRIQKKGPALPNVIEEDFAKKSASYTGPVINNMPKAPQPLHEALQGVSIDDDLQFYSRNASIDTKYIKPEVENSAKTSAKKNEAVKPPGDITEKAQSTTESVYSFPPTSILSRGDRYHSKAGDGEVVANITRLEEAFRSFGVNVSISETTRGPSVTRYEAELEAGVKLSKLTGLADDIALSLGATGVRIAAMPNKIATVGIEVPNRHISTVYLRDIIESSEFADAKSKLTFAIGMDISGHAVTGDIPKLPHMLVAGTTGSGKSVCLNSIIVSILYKATPDDVRFIMIDPKMVEFKVYNKIPHLLVPVVTDVKKAAGALQWATFEMMKRYTLFSETNARDISGYNKIAAKKSEEDREPLPQIIVIIDELADLMITAAKEVEESVCRIAQMGRAAGIHLIIATQSPRADVITGLMKANIPSRIAFKVASALESRIILDPGSSADKLVGNGDMLYAPTGSSKPMRLQGTWISDKEREKVIDFVMKSAQTDYSEEVMHEIEKAAADKATSDKTSSDATESEYDELLPQAVDIIFESGQASVSSLQRRLKLGYARAARIVDQMEELGVVGPYEGSKPRTILISKDDWRQMQYVTGVAPADTPNMPQVSSVSDDEE